MRPQHTEDLLRHGRTELNAADLLQGTGVDVCTVVGFPLGANRCETKAAEAAKAKKAKRKDYYKILGVVKGEGDAAIRKAYKKMSLKWHPDKNS